MEGDKDIQISWANVRNRGARTASTEKPSAPETAEGNGQANQSETIQISAKVVGPPITHKAGDEKSPSFWSLFARGEGDRIVEKATAIYVAKTIVDEALGGGRGNQAIVAFKETEPITIADVLSVIERLCGGPAGWQRLQKKANYSASA